MTATVHCTACGATVGVDWKFCEACGAEQLVISLSAGTAPDPTSVPDVRIATPTSQPSPFATALPSDAGAFVLPAVAPGGLGETPAIQVGESAVTIGRSPDCDVVLEDRAVSAHHVVLTSTLEGIHFRDLGSTSGTWHNGLPRKSGSLGEGDKLGVGHHFWTRSGPQLVPDDRQSLPLEAHLLEVKAGSTTLLEPTSLSIGEGELMAIIGPSGSGKSTLLKALGGVRPSSSGSVLVRGDDVGLRQADIGYVPQDDTLHHLLSVHEALSFAARLRLPEDHAKEERAVAIESVLQQVGLADIADRRIGNLSGGQRKRAAVALELISEPELLLLDEPTTGLDPGLERRLMELARELADKGQSVLLVTHATQSLDLCDRVAVMAPGGHLAYLGPPDGAPEAFGVERIDEVYAKLSSDDDRAEAASRPEADTAISPPRPASSRVVPRRRIWPQVRVLARRYALLFIRDRRNAKILAAQVLVLAFGSAFLFSSNVFAYESNGFVSQAAQSAQLLFLIVTVSLWFGAISSARQVVAERSVLTRELAAGVRTEAYLVSKGLVLGAVAALQTALFVWIVFKLRPLGNPPHNAEIAVMTICVLVSWVGVGLGLTLSAFARSENQATSFLPLILLPQLLFAGAIVTTKDLGEPIRTLSHLVAAQWGFASVGNAIDLNGRIADDPGFAHANHYSSNFFNHGELQAAVALLLMIAACAAVLQARLRPSFEDTWWRQFRQWAERKLQERREIQTRRLPG
jgi:ABC-type multidrug transport system ATPase subunit/ABC-type multidrug transport system permease subunit